MASYIFSFTPTFTQGLLLGQISILLLLGLVLKYLFLDTSSTFRPPALNVPKARKSVFSDADVPTPSSSPESAEWFNVILQHIAQAYRRELRNNMSGPPGDEAARLRIESWVNERRGVDLLDAIEVHSVDIGTTAPKLLSARVTSTDPSQGASGIECDISYTDSVSISLSTSLLLHYPTPSFARLPVSLTMTLALFSAKVTVTPPSSSDPIPCLTLTLDPSFTLDAKTSSLLGSRAKLSDVPKVHEMIAQRIRNTLAARGTWKVLLPGVRTKDVVDMLEKKQ